LAQGFAAEALPHLERAGLLYLHALALLDANRVPEAIQELLQVQARRPDDPDVLFNLGKAAGQLMQQSFNRLMRLHPGSARASELEGQNYLGQRRGDLAEPAFREVLKAQPRQPGIHLALGKIFLERGDLDAAEKELRAEAELSPGNAETAWLLGSVLLKKGKGSEALIELQRSDRLKPEMLETLFDLGRAYAMENQLEPAQKTFAHMIEIEDRSELAAAAHLQLSQILRRMGRDAEAAQHLKRFRELKPQ
jgi:predicted Zn-dependent protease